MSPDPQNRAKRYRVGRMHVIYDTGESFWSGPVVDVSESGIFVETHHTLPVGTRVTLLPDVPEDEQLPFEIQAQVVRVNEFDPDDHFDRTPGMAFLLVGMSAEQIAKVRQFLEARGVPLK
jgi:hypothetical protein